MSGAKQSLVDVDALVPEQLDEERVIAGVLQGQLERVPFLEVDDFHSPARWVYIAARNLEARREPIQVETVHAELVRYDQLAETHGAQLWPPARLKALSSIAIAGELVLAASIRMREARARRELVLERELAAERQEHEVDEFALRDVPRPDDPPAPPKSDPLCPPLVEFLGDEEPDNSDAEDWIIRDIVPRGEAALWGGPMKSGKTWAAMDLLVAMALGENWLGFENTLGRPARVLGLFLEDGRRRLRKRLWELCRARGRTPNDPLLLENLRISRELISLPDDATDVAKRLRSWKPDVVIVDNLTRVMVGDPNSTRDASSFTKAWLRLCSELGATIMPLHHVSKPGAQDKGGGDPFDRLRGSSDFGAAARHLIVSRRLDVAKTEQLTEVCMRGNLDLQRNSFALAFERAELLGRWRALLSNRGDVDELKEQAKKSAKDDRKRERRAEAERLNREVLRIARDTGSVSASRIAEMSGEPRSTAGRRLKELIESGDLVRGAKTSDPCTLTARGRARLEAP